MLRQQQGSSLLEVIVAASLGLLIVLSLQRIWVWQMGQQQRAGDATRAFLTAQSLVEQVTQDIANSDPSAIDLRDECYLLPQQDGRRLAYRIHNHQLQRHTLASHCPQSGWQSLSHYHFISIKSLHVELLTAATSLPSVRVALTAYNSDNSSYSVFNREVVLNVEP